MTDTGGLWAGASEADTTPSLGTDLGGYFESRFADKIERPLAAKALAFRSGDSTVVLVSVDILMMRAVDIVDRAKELITERTGVPADHVMVSATHTHFGPATVHRGGGPTVDPAYLVRVAEAIAIAAGAAVANLRPARIGFGQAPVNGVCFNRRFRRTDGMVEFNPGTGRDDIVEPAGPIDPTVTGLIVEDRDGTPIAFWANLSLHYVNADRDTSISNDYFGAFGDRIAQLLGRPVRAQLTNGCSGDINNVDLSRAVPEQNVARAELVATAVAGAAAAGSMMARRHTDVPVSSKLIMVELERALVTAEDLQIAADALADRRDDVPFSYVKGMPIPPKQVKHYAARLQEMAELPESAAVPVMIMAIGDLCIVGLPGEIFVEHGLAIRDGSRHPITAVVGLANDHIGYVPTERACAEGAYETWRGPVSWTAPGSGERLVAAALAEMGR
ncbi:hypothetical protein [Microlunatus sp. Y2014]|uniref:hypothetical protein n=1 Tax=Microlunatus sp. Y2014 TaxID=3418488 RepID=UPI003DA79520